MTLYSAGVSRRLGIGVPWLANSLTPGNFSACIPIIHQESTY
jgi:hypothetical protein